MFVCCEWCELSGGGLYDGLITHPEESYRLWRIVVCDQETSKTKRLKPSTGLWKYNHNGLWRQENKQTTNIFHEGLWRYGSIHSIPALDKSDWPASRFRCCAPLERAPGPHFNGEVGGWKVPETVCTLCGWVYSAPSVGSSPQYSYYVDLATAEPVFNLYCSHNALDGIYAILLTWNTVVEE